ncbi:hypothetical protein C8F01DRAFT_1166626 [Mycena amicta]|nr:hypothetical protein C8F01DRAFT_1166626 [Mycena amicta]
MAGPSETAIPSPLSHVLASKEVTPGLLWACSEDFTAYKALIAAYPHAIDFGLGHVGDILGFAVERADTAFIYAMLHEPGWNIDPNKSEAWHQHILEYAAESGRNDAAALRCLLIDCADIVIPLRMKGTHAIKAAIRGRRMDCLRLLLDHAPEGRKEVVDGWPLRDGLHSWEITRLTELGWNVPNLHYAVKMGAEEAVRILLEAGADPNIKDGMGNRVDVSMFVEDKKGQGSTKEDMMQTTRCCFM